MHVPLSFRKIGSERMQVHGVTIGLTTPIPILAKAVRAGFPSPADDFIEDEIDLQRLLIANRPATFLVRVAGDRPRAGGCADGGAGCLRPTLRARCRRPGSRAGFAPARGWPTKFEMRSPRYTTRLDEIPVVAA